VQFVLLASLWWLEEHEQPPTQTRLAEQAATEPMMTSQVLRRLEARGLLERRDHPDDSRARLLTITKAGRNVLAGALADVETADREYFRVLGAGRRSFVEGLRALGAPMP
jgi:DNA-binding MarR family transcriptional regulator